MTIHLGIAFDNNYLAPFYALAASIFDNNLKNRIVIHAIVSGISDVEKEAINMFALANNSEVNYYTIDFKFASKFVLTNKWTSAVYYRLYFPLMVPSSVNRLIYLDTDTLVLDNLETLYNLDLDDHPVGAVYDNYVRSAPELGIINEGDYFNSGVLLIDIEKWNKQKISEKAFDFLNKYPDKIKFVDQDALNAVLINNWKKLDVKYNFIYSLIPEGISKKQLFQLIEDKVVLHYTFQRPWFLLCKNRLRSLYFGYLKKSPKRHDKSVIDFELKKIPALLKIRTIEFYFDSPNLQYFWRKIKS